MALRECWGRAVRAKQDSYEILWRTEVKFPIGIQKKLLPYGKGRSYGDCCLNDGGSLLPTEQLNHFIEFDFDKGILHCESGVTLGEILSFSVPRGFIFPVLPGTKHVTVGGAIANDIHGKNHHVAGTFGRYVLDFNLLRSNGQLYCSREKNNAFFRATIGGVGLTGLILDARIQLKPIQSAWIEVNQIRTENLEQYFNLTQKASKDYEYIVAWIDGFARGPRLGRGILFLGNHLMPTIKSSRNFKTPKKFRIPFDLPDFFTNSFAMCLLNHFYYTGTKASRVNKTIDQFFFPLDRIEKWNRLYGAKGFFQYQCVIPKRHEAEGIQKILELASESNRGSFLGVLKNFGALESPGLLSFPVEGSTLALDFPNRPGIAELFNHFDAVVMKYGGRIYPAKDAWMSAAMFRTQYPDWQKFQEFVDPKFSSSWWKRVNGQ